MTSGFKRIERIEGRPRETRSHRHRTGTRSRASIYREFEIGNLAEKVNWAERRRLLIRDSVCRGGVSDSSAVYDKLDAAIALAAVGGIIRGNGLRFSKAARGDR
jgi:hypothetical protein